MKRFLHFLLLFSVLLSACGVSQPPPVKPPTHSLPGEDASLQPSPVPTLPPPPLVVRAVEESSFSAFIPSSPIVLEFNQPVDPASANPILLTYPWVEGDTSWNAEKTRLTFTPASTFEPGQVYQVFVNQGVRSQAGASLPAAAQWQVATQDAPTLVKRTPGHARLLTRRPVIELTFDRPMDPDGVQAALQVSPALDFEVSWKDEKTASLVLSEPLQPGERYRFALDGAAPDQRGVHLGRDLHWDYWLDDSTVAVSGPNVKNPRLPVTLKFFYPVDIGSVTSALKIEPSMNASYRWSNAQELSIVPENPLPRGTSYTISFTGPVLDAHGDPLPEVSPLTFHSPPPIIAYMPSQEDTVFIDTEIAIEFDRPMHPEKTQAAFQIDPPVDGKFAWEGNTLVFKPSGLLRYMTTYHVTVGTGAAGAGGEAILLEPFTFQFTTGYESLHGQESYLKASFGSYGPNAQVVDANGRRVIQYLRPNPSQPILFQLYSLDLEQFLDRYSSGFRGVAGPGFRPLSVDDLPLAAMWESSSSDVQGGYNHQISELTIPSHIPVGLYILDLQVNGVSNDKLIVVLTAHTLTVKQAEGQIVAWMSNINGGGLPFSDVEVYARDGALLASGQAGMNGVFRATVDRNPEPLIVIGRSGADITVSGLSNEWRGAAGYWWGWWAPAPVTPHYAAYLYTDRPIYRPGHTVFYKVITRADEDAAISLLPPGTPVTVRMRDARDNVVRSYELATNGFGSVEGQFDLAEGAMLGDYYLEAVVGGESFYQKFKVQEYRKPDFQVHVSTDREQYVDGDTMVVTVNASYFFGEPVANAAVTLRRYYLQPMYTYSTTTYGSDEPQYNWAPVFYSEVSGVTDEDGVVTFEVQGRTDEMWSDEYNGWSNLIQKQMGFEATLDDGTHQMVTGFASASVYNADTEVLLDAGSYLKRPGEPFTVGAQVNTIEGQPVNASMLALELRRWTSGTWRYDTIVQSTSFTTEMDGKARTDFTIKEAGFYQLRVTGTDGRGFPIMNSVWIYAYSGNRFFSEGNRDELKISSDQNSYAPDDTATLVIESNFSGPALLTFERGRVHREQLIQLTPPLTLVPVTVAESDAPNIFVTVNAWKALDATLTENTYSSIPDSSLLSASTELKVPVRDKTLTVMLTPDQPSYAPRQEAVFTVQVTGADGRGVQAEVSLALVDEAIFSLSSDLSRPIFSAFYADRKNIVRTYNTMALRRELFGFGRGGGGGDDVSGNPRSDFQDTAAWLPVVETGPDGFAQVTFTLPDNLTTWRLTARAVTQDTQVGETVTHILTHQETIVQPALPRGLTTGDRLDLSAMVHNYSNRVRQLRVAVEMGPHGESLLQTTGVITQVVTLAPGEVRLVSWPVEALQPGMASVTVSAYPSGAPGEPPADAVRLPLPIYPRSAPEVMGYAGSFEEEFYTTLLVPDGALPVSTAQLVLTRSIAGSVLDGLEYLTGYPYGCVEQTMSKALPNAVVGRAFARLEVENLTIQADLPGQVNAGLQRLYGYQHNDGGWGWWYDDLTHDYQTAWVVFGLAMTAEAGYEVDPKVIERGAAWLEKNLSTMDPRTQAYALYSLALAGQGSLETTRSLAARYYELDVFSQSALALSLHRLGAQDEARQILSSLAEMAVVENRPSGQFVYWPQPEEDGYYYAKTMASTTRSTALALSAFAQASPEHSLLPGIVRWLMAQRRQTGWGTTNETSYAILGLTDHLLTAERDGSAAQYVVDLNGVEIASGSLEAGTAGKAGSLTLDLPFDTMNPGLNLLHVRQTGARLLYYKVSSRMYTPVEEIEASGWLTLSRMYTLPGTRQPLAQVRAGDLVQVHLTIQAPQKGFFMVLEDHLPGGLEALNESLNTTSHEALAYDEEPASYWREYLYNNKEIRDDRVSFFITELQAGTTTIKYLARAIYSGEFHALPAEAYAMYEPDAWGRSGSASFQVVP